MSETTIVATPPANGFKAYEKQRVAEMAAEKSGAEKKVEEPKSSSSPEKAASTEVVETTKQPASEPGKAQGEKVPRSERRIKQLLAHVKELESQLVQRKTEPPAAKAEPAPKPQELKEPKLEEFQNYEDFVDSRADYRAQLRVKEALDNVQKQNVQQRKDAEIQQANKQIEELWAKRLTESSKAHTDFNEVVLESGFLDEIPKGSMVDAFILESQTGGELLYYLATTDGELERVLAAPNPIAQTRELVRLEAVLSSKKRAPKVSGAPEPGIELGHGDSPVADEATEAVKSRDFKLYEAARRRQIIASKKG